MNTSLKLALNSWLKAFIAAMLSFVLLQYSNGLPITSLSIWAVVGSGIAGVLPAIYKYFNNEEGFLNTFWGSWIKSLITIGLSLVIERLGAGISIFALDWVNIANATIAGLIPSLINWLDPNNTRYGISK